MRQSYSKKLNISVNVLVWQHALVFFFFFSSRRRHTRFDCDWSSDVCSSDLCDERADLSAESRLARRSVAPWPARSGHRSGEAAPPFILLGAGAAAVRSLRERSEEHTSELQSQSKIVCRLLLEKKKSRQQLCLKRLADLAH